jgi:uncharacterized membrane protein YfcA
MKKLLFYTLIILFFKYVNSQNLTCNKCYFTDCPINCNDDLWFCNKDNYCLKKDFDIININSNDILLFFLISASVIISSLVGIGGGGLLLPIYLTIGNFGFDYSIPITIITICSSSFIRMILLFNTKHPYSLKRYLIDFSILMIIIPFDGSFAYFGFILNIISPTWFLIIFILLVLLTASIKTFKKAISQKKIEKLNNNNENTIIIDGLSLIYNKLISIEIDGININLNEDIYKDVTSSKVGENKKKRYKKLIFIIFLTLLISIFSITKNYFKKCSNLFYLFNVIQFIILFSIGFFICKYNINEYNLKKKKNFIFLKGDINWNKKKVIIFSVFSSFVGFVSTFLGIGGGMLISPFLIQMNILPEVISATNSVSTFFSSFISSIQYINSGKILLNYSIISIIISSISSFIGLKLSFYIINKFKRRSYIIFFLAFIIFISTILLIVISVNKIINGRTRNNFISYCKL